MRVMLCYDIAFDGGAVMGQLVLPRDLTEQEVERLCALLRTLPMPSRQSSSQTDHADSLETNRSGIDGGNMG